MKMNKYLAVFLLSSCWLTCGATSVQTNSAAASPPKPIPLTQEQDDALVRAGILPPADQPPPAISTSKFSDDAIKEIISLYDKKAAVRAEYQKQDISVWRTIDVKMAKYEEASDQNDLTFFKLQRDLLLYRLTHPPVDIYLDYKYGGLIGVDSPDVTDKENAAINYNKRFKEYSMASKSLLQPLKRAKKFLALRKQHDSQFHKLDILYGKKLNNLDQQLSDLIKKDAQPAR